MEPKIVDIPEKWAHKTGRGKMVVLTPLLVDQYIRKIPKGKLVTINMIRSEFAKQFDVDMTCPLTTGIFAWLSAWTAEEDRKKGMKDIAPYWRVLKEGGKLNPKFPGGVSQQASLLSREGFVIVKGRTPDSMKVKDYEQFLVTNDYEDVV